MRLITLIALAAGTAWFSPLLSQGLPPGPCNFPGFASQTKLARITAATPVTAYFACSSDARCAPTPLDPRALILAYKTAGPWTCGYIPLRNGSGPGWVPSKDIRLVRYNPDPPTSAWLGYWFKGTDNVSIRKAKEPEMLRLQGEASWHSSDAVVHTGGFDGVAIPHKNHLHFVERAEDSCTVDLNLIGQYLVVSDNHKCGGSKVRFGGIWRRVRQ